MTTTPTACQPLAATLEELEAERLGLQAELQIADTSQKPRLATAIKALHRRVADIRKDLVDCLATTTPDPDPPPPLQAVLSGMVTLSTTSPWAPNPTAGSVTLDVVFDGPRTFVGISSFPPVTGTTVTPLGTNQTTVTKTGGGAGSFSAGQIVLPITLHLDNSIDFVIGDSDLSLVLTTATPGSPVSPTGAVTLTGTGPFTGGILGGSLGTVALTGTITPAP